ncbi:hypothetical protein [Corynebacterium cystitidis]|uniref:Uncharacterized protein n=1 Tax=Corynebacterium cystitidis DSM 20524 TaxID=1121357 RepID=A0A1H9WC68_9CORY|nr:hypothetical protein [Corynebacterium cystitidis]WJY82971.1 hypothetical protein CCYS_10305 [Corynebacterium cystitidis DSM 20524]SES31257.1 hypothetical protein SAMN05661109_02654 [Corynebacterium cystitidis DSM 20524]SNV68021.1 Uncharacterised protein [Corynebacterium cystitidis]
MHNRRFNPVLVTSPVRSRDDLYTALANVLYPACRPAPTNLDGLADMLRESRVRRVIASHWELNDDDTRQLSRVFKDMGVELMR